MLDDQETWTGPMAEFGIPATIRDPPRAEFTVFVQDDGVLIRGSVTGTVSVP